MQKKYYVEEYVGSKVNSLTITGNVRKDKRGTPQWEVQCTCGCLSFKDPGSLVNGVAQSCNNCYDRNYKGTKSVPGAVLSRLQYGADKRNIKVDITLDDLQEQWDEQDGLCAYTGIPLTVPRGRKVGDASVDRIDSSLGYIRSNIQWVHKRINSMKNDMDEEEFLFMCKLVTDRANP